MVSGGEVVGDGVGGVVKCCEGGVVGGVGFVEVNG